MKQWENIEKWEENCIVSIMAHEGKGMLKIIKNEFIGEDFYEDRTDHES
jgi:hypothetical protein